MKENKNGNWPGNFEPSLEKRSTSTESSSRAYTKEKTFLTNPEKFKHTKPSENDSRIFKHTEVGEITITKNDFQT